MVLKNNKMNQVQLEIKENIDGIDFIMKNFNDLGHLTIKKLEEFSLKRNGYFRYDLKQFGIKRKLNNKHILKIFEFLEIDVIILESSKTMENLSISNERVDFGKHKGCMWKDIPLDYLKWLYKTNENKYAYEEIKRRENILPNVKDEVIKIGEYRGRKWVDVPIDYLEWILSTFESHNKNYKLAKMAVNEYYD